jgi:deoxyribodipyrimidine photo-lyase
MSVLPPIDDPVRWVDTHLGHVTLEGPGSTVAARRIRGGQAAADAALDSFDVRGYARRRSEVLPIERRGASQLSPYVRHGLLPLRSVWDHVARSGAPSADVEKFHDELLWQEYARHLYARLGPQLARPLRGEPHRSAPLGDPWDTTMACLAVVLDELEREGWIVNQTRMWMASQWTVRHGAAWLDGEHRFFQHLLDGSRAANRSGWQWTIGSGNGKPYGFSRWQVEKRAPGLCDSCAHRHHCPIQEWPRTPDFLPRPDDTPSELLRADPHVSFTAGPDVPEQRETVPPAAVWITAESLGHRDPALHAHPDVPAIFVFDEPLLRQLRLSSKRLVFLAETLAGLAEDGRPLTVMLGDPAIELHDTPVATTFAPVPRWHRYAAVIRPVIVHPWAWLRRPAGESLQSFSAWRGRGDGLATRRKRTRMST